MELPIYIDNQVCARLHCSRQGLYRVFEAELENTGELRRLYLAGPEGFYNLGLFKPEGRRAVFYKRLTRLEWEKLPKNISCAHAVLNDAEPGQLIHKKQEENIKKPQHSPQIWQELPDGCLFACIRNRQYLAIPALLRGPVRGIRRIKYKKLEYIVFRY